MKITSRICKKKGKELRQAGLNLRLSIFRWSPRYSWKSNWVEKCATGLVCGGVCLCQGRQIVFREIRGCWPTRAATKSGLSAHIERCSFSLSSKLWSIVVASSKKNHLEPFLAIFQKIYPISSPSKAIKENTSASSLDALLVSECFVAFIIFNVYRKFLKRCSQQQCIKSLLKRGEF